MKILFDQGTPVPLRELLVGHVVETAYERGWSTLSNGELLVAAEMSSFNVLVTTDQNLRHHQDHTNSQLAVLVLPTTRWAQIRRHAAEVVDAVQGTVGAPLVIEGRVLSTDCRPIAGAVLDVWSCDGMGVYDNDGFKLRGHQFTDNQGAFHIETVKPADYRQFGTRRTPHVHVKVQGRETSLLTTQLYFPGESLNTQDGLFNESLLLTVEKSGDGSLRAVFDFVLTPRPEA
jgi:protocatechuate 3,4-dioxygenase beta subunit